MKRVVSIDGITFDNKLFISSEFDADDFIGSKELTVDGSSVMFIQPKGAMTKEVQIYSKSSGWVSEETKVLLENTVDELSKIVIFSDASSGTYYYDHTKVPLIFKPLYDGAIWYTIELNLIKG